MVHDDRVTVPHRFEERTGHASYGKDGGRWLLDPLDFEEGLNVEALEAISHPAKLVWARSHLRGSRAWRLSTLLSHKALLRSLLRLQSVLKSCKSLPRALFRRECGRLSSLGRHYTCSCRLG